MQIPRIIYFSLVLLLISFNQEIYAQEAVPRGLYQGLGDLKRTVDQLTVTNQTVLLKNDKIKASLKDLEIAFQRLTQENLRLEDAKAKLQKIVEPKNQQISQLNQALKDLDTQDQAFTRQAKEIQDKITDLKNQDLKLSNSSIQIKDDSQEYSSKTAEILQKKQKQKLALLKLIAQSQTNQSLLQEKFLDFKKNYPMSVDAVSMVGKKTQLEDQVFQLQNEIVQLNAIIDGSKSAWSEQQINQLELSVNDLERNRDELKSLISKMQQKTNHIAKFEEKSNERTKLESNIEMLKQDTKSLRIDQEELQQQMIDLDKRKSYLETLLQK